MKTTTDRYDVGAIRSLMGQLFAATGLEKLKTDSVVSSLISADMMGHFTHGLALAPWYLKEAQSGAMTLAGEPDVISDRGSCIAWDGRLLPGSWLIDRAVDIAIERVAAHGVVTVTIARGHHTGALATYLPRLTQRGLMVVLACSSPSANGVAPFGGTRGVFTPNPLSAGIPTSGDPVLLDSSCSITTINRCIQAEKAGETLPSDWLMNAFGEVTNDPTVLTQGEGTLLPVGGTDHGYKGYAMALLVESLTQGLGGHGRRTRPQGTMTSTFLQVIDPSAFGGKAAYVEETDWLVDACHLNPPRPSVDRVRVPGDQAMARMRKALVEGVALDPSILSGLQPYATLRGLTLPSPLPRTGVESVT